MDNTETIEGVGIDLCKWDEVPAYDEKHPFFRLFSKGEIERCLSKPNPRHHLASNFAAREALIKAFGEYQSWMGRIEVVNNGYSAYFSGPIPSGIRLLLSITTNSLVSMAIVFLLKK